MTAVYEISQNLDVTLVYLQYTLGKYMTAPVIWKRSNR